ncbi:hypothetical protein [Sorangium cellulosum]|uniref:Uncharacterized protein n=1 Tax=Sorangium cellulosum TaxID=56 RepID=A0A150Q980_SORCE|nr:hypothetical protein [Sorangium cellulosum]KYF64529.1 hypothetical protein BE15_04495 [Sorangium cellulosum]
MSAAPDLARLLRFIESGIRRLMVYSWVHPYRVMSQNVVSGRLNLQAVNEGDVLLPQLVEVPKAHGSPGIDEKCRPGTIVLVGFQGGNPGAPFIAHYIEPVRRPGEAETPQTPLELELDAENEIRAGAGATRGGARVNDTVTVLLPPATFVGTIGGSPASGMVVWSPGQTTGTITTGSGKVKIA